MPKNMKILTTRDRKSAGGGIVAFIESILPFFKSDVRCVDVGRPHSFFDDSDPVAKNTFLRMILDYSRFIAGIISFNPDIIHINTSLDMSKKAILRDSVYIFISKLFRKKVLVYWHGWAYKKYTSFPYRGGDRGTICGIYKSSDAFVVMMSGIKEQLLNWGFKKPIYLCTTSYDSLLMPEGLLRKHEKDNKNILFLSSVLKEKGVIELLKAYDIVRRKHPEWGLTVCGDGPFLEEARAFCETEKIREVKFAGQVGPAEKKKHLDNSDIFCLLSYEEVFPVAVLEALAMGLPVVCSDAGALEDIIKEGVNGFVIRRLSEVRDGLRFDVNMVAEKVSKLIEDRRLREKISMNNAPEAKQKYYPGVVAERLENIYNQILQE